MYGPGMMGPGMMGPGMMWGYGRNPGYGRMYGPGYGMMGPGMMWDGQQRCSNNANRNLSTADVKRNLERWLAIRGNDRLKVGEIKEADNDSIKATIVTKKENAIVQKFSIDKRTGFTRPISE